MQWKCAWEKRTGTFVFHSCQEEFILAVLIIDSISVCFSLNHNYVSKLLSWLLWPAARHEKTLTLFVCMGNWLCNIAGLIFAVLVKLSIIPRGAVWFGAAPLLKLFCITKSHWTKFSACEKSIHSPQKYPVVELFTHWFYHYITLANTLSYTGAAVTHCSPVPYGFDRDKADQSTRHGTSEQGCWWDFDMADISIYWFLIMCTILLLLVNGFTALTNSMLFLIMFPIKNRLQCCSDIIKALLFIKL